MEERTGSIIGDHSRTSSRSGSRTGSTSRNFQKRDTVYKPNRRISTQLRQSHLNLNQKDIARRYAGIQDQKEITERQQRQDIQTAVAECKSCFTENYLVFSLKERNPQETKHFLDREDDVLDLCRTVNFNRNARRMEQANSNLRDQGVSSIKQLPDEIDGDERVSSSRRSSIVNASIDSANPFNLDRSQFIDQQMQMEKQDPMKRYSIVGND